MAYSVAKNDVNFVFDEFDNKSLEDKLEYFLEKFSVNLKKGERPYQTIKLAITWRNSLAHSKPTYVEKTEISPEQDIREIPQQHVSTKNKYTPYDNFVTEQNADRFNRDIIQVIEKIKTESGINPRAQCVHQNT